MSFQTRKQSSVPQKTGIGGPGELPWSPQGRGEGLRERGKLRVEKVGFPSPFCLTTLQKVEFALLFQKQKQDSSIKLRRTIAKSTAFCSFCAFAKKNAVSLTNQGCKGCQNKALCTAESSVHSKKLCAQRKALCTAESSVHRKRLCAQEKALRTGKRLCAQEKALCTGKSSVHGTGKSSVHATIPEKGARTSQKQRKTSNRPIPSGSGPVNCFVIYCISSLSRSRYGPQTLKRPRQNNLFPPEYPY